MPAVAAAAGDWNDLLAPGHDNPDPALRERLGYAPFSFDTAKPACLADSDDTDDGMPNTGYVKVSDTRECYAATHSAATDDVIDLTDHEATDCEAAPGEYAALAHTTKSSAPLPRIGGNLLDEFPSWRAGASRRLRRVSRPTPTRWPPTPGCGVCAPRCAPRPAAPAGS